MRPGRRWCARWGSTRGDEASAGRALDDLAAADHARLIEPVLVWREWAEGSPELSVAKRALGGAREYAIELRLEDGSVERASGRLPDAGDTGERVHLPLPVRPPLGYHDVKLVVQATGSERTAHQRLVMAPRTVVQPEEILGEGGAYGIWANLYSVRAQGDWGHGGLRELVELGRLAGRLGAAFVGVNPLHAVTNRGLEFSPYGPSSRLYRNVLYLDPEAVPELAVSEGAKNLIDDVAQRTRRRALEARSTIDHEAVLDALLPVLRELYRTFCQGASPARKEAFDGYRAREGERLGDFATWETLAAPPRRSRRRIGIGLAPLAVALPRRPK